MLEHRWKQLRRQTIHSINQRRIDLDESDQHSEFPRVGYIGRRFDRQSFYWWCELDHKWHLVCSLDECEKRRCDPDIRQKHPRKSWWRHRFWSVDQSGGIGGPGFSLCRSLGHEHERSCLSA